MVGVEIIESSAREHLRRIVQEGISVDLYWLEESFNLLETISKHSDEINNASYGRFFGSTQAILGRFIILQSAKLFEDVSMRYLTSSICSALDLLDKESSSIAIEQNGIIITTLIKYSAESISHCHDDRGTTNSLVRFFKSEMTSDAKHFVGLADSILRVKTVRDKVIAHPEMVDINALSQATYDDITKLVTFAKVFLATIGFGYLSIAYSDESDSHLLSSDAKRASISLERLLNKAGIVHSSSNNHNT